MSPSFNDALQDHPEGVMVSLVVHPGARTTRCFIVYDPWRKALTCEVAAEPEQGKANRELQREIAGYLDLPLSAVTLLSGERSHRKTILIHGLSQEDLSKRLSHLRSDHR
jgi:uncharacterized protein (TIGR00251 family)